MTEIRAKSDHHQWSLCQEHVLECDTLSLAEKPIKAPLFWKPFWQIQDDVLQPLYANWKKYDTTGRSWRNEIWSELYWATLKWLEATDARKWTATTDLIILLGGWLFVCRLERYRHVRKQPQNTLFPIKLQVKRQETQYKRKVEKVCACVCVHVKGEREEEEEEEEVTKRFVQRNNGCFLWLLKPCKKQSDKLLCIRDCWTACYTALAHAKASIFPWWHHTLMLTTLGTFQSSMRRPMAILMITMVLVSLSRT